jgi:hypothetical protein
MIVVFAYISIGLRPVAVLSCGYQAEVRPGLGVGRTNYKYSSRSPSGMTTRKAAAKAKTKYRDPSLRSG